MLASPVFGSRTWICTIAAPALAASIAAVAICSGVTGTAGFFPTLSADPVTAHEIITLRDTAALPEAFVQLAYNAPPEGDMGSLRMPPRQSLPLIVRCAKPRRTPLLERIQAGNSSDSRAETGCSVRA